MRICRIQIKNFRNFANLDVAVSGNTVIVGENKIGKSNFIYALRLLLDPTLPDSARSLRREDFWDGLGETLTAEHSIAISVDFTDFELNMNELAVLAEHLIQPEPMIARLTYVWQPISGLGSPPTKESDYEFAIFGGDRPESHFSSQIRRRIPLEFMPALRDCEGDLSRWSRSPLRPLLDKAAGQLDPAALAALAQEVDKSTEKVAAVEEVQSVADSIATKLSDMVGAGQAIDTVLRFSPTDPNKLIRALRLFIDGGRRAMADASLGSANLLYLALKTLENEQLVTDGDRDHTFVTIEEPEAHLHPTLQRLVFRNYLRLRVDDGQEERPRPSSVLLTTHSPHVVSVTPLRNLIVLRHTADGTATEARSTAAIEFSKDDVDDLERYLDVNRGELFFARGVILVEGDAEKYLLPIIAKNNGIDLDELGISVCSISGTNFRPYCLLLGPLGLDVPLAVVTDYDPREPKADGTIRKPLGPSRVVKEIMPTLIGAEGCDAAKFADLLARAAENGVFLNSHTFEVNLFDTALSSVFQEAMSQLGTSEPMKRRMSDWASQSEDFDAETFLKDIESVGKGRFAQRLASILAKSGENACAPYILKAINHVASRCKRN